MQESETKVIDLSSDGEDAIGCLLLYLYTLTVPDSVKTSDMAGKAYSIGDKYGVPELHNAGKRYIIDKSIPAGLNKFQDLTEQMKKGWLSWIKSFWPQQTKGGAEIGEAIIKALLAQSQQVVAHPECDELLLSDEDFRCTFLRALAKKAAGGS